MTNNQINQIIWEYKNNNEIIDENTKIKVNKFKNRLYSVLNIIIIIIILYIFIIPLSSEFKTKSETLDRIIKQEKNIELKQIWYKKNIELLNLIKLKNKDIINYINWNKKTIDNIIMTKKKLVRDYLLLNDLKSSNMEIDEKKLLRNINEYLLRNKNRKKIWTVKKIEIGEEEKIQNSLYFLPVKINAKFNNKDYLLEFINNVEKNIPVNFNDRILIKIWQISYDVTKYNETQDVTILLSVYYFNII